MSTARVMPDDCVSDMHKSVGYCFYKITLDNTMSLPAQ